MTATSNIAVGARVKAAGEEMVGEEINLIAHHHPIEEMMPYERLLGDAMRGDLSLFARQDSVEAAWRVIDPILRNMTPPEEYEPGSWGPPKAHGIIADHGSWYNPKEESK